MISKSLRGLVVLSLLFVQHAQSAEPTQPGHQTLNYFLDSTGRPQTITKQDEWETRRRQIVAGMTQVFGELPAASNRVPLDVKILEEITVGNVSRRKLSFQSDPTDRVTAYLLMPTVRKAKTPAVLCLHQTTQIGKGEPVGLGGDARLHYAKHLADKGFIVLAPDYPSFGDHAYDFAPRHGYSSGSMKAIWDNIRAVDYLQSLAEVDGDRIGCIGHSLGGHNAMFTSVFEPRLKVIVSSCGFCRFHRDDLPSWTGPRYLPRIATKFQNDPEKMPFDFPEIVAAFAPRPFLACAATHDDDFDVRGVKESLEAAMPIYQLLGKKENLLGYYPESGHAFPEDAREVAYRFLEQHLGNAQ